MNANFKINGTIIETERLILRPFAYADLNDLYEYAKVDGVGEMAGWPHHHNIEESQRILTNFINEDKTFAIVLKENNKVIGSLGIEKYGSEDKLSEFDGLLGREIGFVLSKTYWGKGFMPEAVKAAISYLFNDLNYDFLICGHDVNNFQSQKVQHKCGFIPYRKIIRDTLTNEKRESILNLLTNPNKNIQLKFSHPETLI